MVISMPVLATTPWANLLIFLLVSFRDKALFLLRSVSFMFVWRVSLLITGICYCFRFVKMGFGREGKEESAVSGPVFSLENGISGFIISLDLNKITE